MLVRFVVSLLFLCSVNPFASAQAQPDLNVPLGATWTMPLERARQLSGLEHTPNGALKASSTVRSNSQVELIARWQGRTISLFFAQGFGLYAIGVEMTPWLVQHSQTGADPEQQDLEYCAPIRLAVFRKYGTPGGITESWDAEEVRLLSTDQRGATPFTEATAIDWPYTRNWIVWEGEETRLALGEQFVWYVSRAGLTYKEKIRQALEQEQLAAQARDREQQARRQLQLDQARQNVPFRAQELESLF